MCIEAVNNIFFFLGQKISSECERADFSSQICFSFKEDSISLDIPKDGTEVNGWEIIPLAKLMVRHV